MKPSSLIYCFCLLISVSCAKKDAEPAPSLEGNWAVQTQARTDTYTNGSVIRTPPYSIKGQQRMVITADSLFIYRRDDSRPSLQKEVLASAHAYTRKGNTLHRNGDFVDIEIKQLTEHSVTLMYLYFLASPSSGHKQQELEFTYSR
jgi:hypothetical protein